jgi:hypothetical protein
VFRAIVELQAAINRFGAEINADPESFVWTTHPDRVIATIQCGKQRRVGALAGQIYLFNQMSSKRQPL